MTLPDLAQTDFSRDDIIAFLSAENVDDIESIRAQAEKVLIKECGTEVYLRGLLEISNACKCDCRYCGIRKSNKSVTRYTLEQDEIIETAKQCASHGYGSLVLQSGERQDKAFIDALEETVSRIKSATTSALLPNGLGITLCVGEQDDETYRRLFAAGAHRYLLRIETTSPTLFAHIHPPEQRLETRLACLKNLREIGYQVGTGVMIGLPSQTLADLADDILFFRDQDIDMIGMGPFIPHDQTPLAKEPCPSAQERLRLGFLMIAATRLVLRDVNIAATTALQALDPMGREEGLRFGANVMMPLMTPTSVSKSYQLYPGKPHLDETQTNIEQELESSVHKVGRTLCFNVWGDAPHARKKTA